MFNQRQTGIKMVLVWSLLCWTSGQAWANTEDRPSWPWEEPVHYNWEALQGTWESIEASVVKPGVEVNGRLNFNLSNSGSVKHPEMAQGEYQLTAICSFYDGTILQVSVKTNVRVSGSNVQTMDPVQSSTQQGSKYCTASIPTQVFQFHINNNVLIMHTASGKYYFQRVN